MGPRAGWWYLRPDPRGRVVSPLLREGQGVKLCSLLSKCPLSCLLPASLPSGRLRSGPGGRRRPELETTLSAASAPGAPGTEGGSRATPEAPTPRRWPALPALFRSRLPPDLFCLSFPGWGGVGWAGEECVLGPPRRWDGPASPGSPEFGVAGSGRDRSSWAEWPPGFAGGLGREGGAKAVSGCPGPRAKLLGSPGRG